MKNKLKWIALPMSLAPMMVAAQDSVVSEQFSETLLTMAIVLGLSASAYVFLLSFRLGGGAIAGALTLYGAGMISVVISLMSVTWWKVLVGSYAGILHDTCFIIGFVLMVVGSVRIARAIR